MALIKLAEGELLNTDVPVKEALADIEVTNRFIKLATELKRLAPRSNDFTYFTAIFMHASEHALIDPKTGEFKKDKNGVPVTGGFDDKWKWSCSDPTITPYYNQNKDSFPESELKIAHTKWRGKPLCKNHESSDIEGIRGIIIDTHYDEKFKRIVGLCAIDSKTYPDLAYKIKSGYASSVSMGTAVSKAICAECGNSAVVEADYCNCMRNKRGEINIGLNPIELSLVVTPADQQAKVLRIIASMNNYVDQRNSLLEEKDHVETTKLAKLDSAISNVQDQLNRLFMECSDSSCQFVRSDDGHIKLIKSAQQAASWDNYFNMADQASATKGDSAAKASILQQMDVLRGSLDVSTLNVSSLLDSLKANDPEVREKLSSVVDEFNLSGTKAKQPQSMQENQFTSPDGPDKDLGLDSASEVTMPQNEQGSSSRVSKVVNPSEVGVKPNKGGDTGPELGSASDRFEFGNYASNKNGLGLMATGGKITDRFESNLNLLLKQAQDIEKEVNKLNKTNNKNAVLVTSTGTTEELKMNEARLKLRAAQRKALIMKQAGEKFECKVCKEKFDTEAKLKAHEDKEQCEGPDAKKKDKTAYWLGTEEPTPGKVKYKPDNGGEPKNRMNDKQMHQDKSMGGDDGLFPGDEAEKKKLLRAELEARALQRRAYWLGTEEPTPGKAKYKADPLRDKLRESGDRQMLQGKSMGGTEGLFPGDEAEKKKLLRAELVPGTLRTKFTVLRHPNGTYNKQGSYLEIFSGNNKILKATAAEIYADDLNRIVQNHDGTSSGKTGWEILRTPEYGKEVMAAIRERGFSKVAKMLKGAQATPMPEMPPMDGAATMPPAAPSVPNGAPPLPEAPVDGEESPELKKVNVNEVMSLLGEAEDKLDQMRSAVTGDSEDEVKDMSVETGDVGAGAPDADKDAAEAAGAELTAALNGLSREVYGELERSADELALLVEYFNKSASLSRSKRAELNKIALDAMADSKALLEEADTIIAVAGKIPPGLKAFQDKQKGKKKGDEKDEEKDDKKKDSAKDKKKDKKDDKKKDKDKKKSKKSELAHALLKLAQELDLGDSEGDFLGDDSDNEGDVDNDDSLLDQEMEDLGLMPENASAADDKMCGMCGMVADQEHYCSASAKDQLVREALMVRKLRREAFLKSSEDKKYDVTSDDHGMLNEAHKGSEANPTTQLDNKASGDGAVVEGLDKKHDAMMDAAESVPTGKQGSAAALKAKEAEIRAELEGDLRVKKADEDKKKFRVRLRRAYDLSLMMQEKALIPRTKEALDLQVDEVMKFDDPAFESYKRVVANTKHVKTASTKALQSGVREDNSQPGDNVGVGSDSIADQLAGMWK